MKKERFEWIHSWCDEAQNGDLPRVLLVGDSITYGYQEKVRALLQGVCYVDYISTSYAIDAKMYQQLIYNFITDSKYDLVHFNNGLHGIHISQRSYKSRLEKLLAKVDKDVKIILATSTIMYREGNKRLDSVWMKRVRERNAVMEELSKERNYAVNDLYALSVSIPKEKRCEDGAHYLEDGYAIFASAVAEKIKEELKK